MNHVFQLLFALFCQFSQKHIIVFKFCASALLLTTWIQHHKNVVELSQHTNMLQMMTPEE